MAQKELLYLNSLSYFIVLPSALATFYYGVFIAIPMSPMCASNRRIVHRRILSIKALWGIKLNRICNLCPSKMWNPTDAQWVNIQIQTYKSSPVSEGDYRNNEESEPSVGSLSLHTVPKVSTQSNHCTRWRCIFRLAVVSIGHVWLTRLSTVSSNCVCVDAKGRAACPPVDARGQTAGLWVNADGQREWRLRRRWCLL